MNIKRNELIAGLRAFVKTKSGVVIGMPGVGKSYSLTQLVIELVEANIPACLIKLDDLTTASDDDFSRMLGIADGIWIDKLKAIPTSANGQSVMVLDAFDTLRNDVLKNKILEQIKRIKSELPEWSLLVSVRTYDAKQSQKLIELFPQEHAEDGIDCRKFNIPELSKVELSKFLEKQDRLKSLYTIANDRLKEIFRIPFFLKLLDRILLKAPEEIASLSLIKSEIELLDRYWINTVGSIKPMMATEVVLRNLTKQMVLIKQLSVDKYDFLENLTRERIELVDRLLSENVIQEQGTMHARISFSHNILFDYAVSKLVVPQKPEDIIRFIEEDPTRPLFLRPSFVYLFTRFWYTDRGEFWKIYNVLSKAGSSDIILFNKLIPSAVVVREFEETADIPWAQQISEHSREIRDILQGFRYLQVRATGSNQVQLLKLISGDIQMEFLGDFSLLFSRLLDNSTLIAQTDIADNGIISRNLFDYCMAHRNDEGIDLENLIAYHAIPAIMKTFGSDPTASKTRIIVILNTVGSPQFNIQQVSSILEGLDTVLDLDEEFLAEIYLRLFGHQETDTSSTTLHTSVLMSFSSSRMDQFNLCHSRLKRFFPKFLKKSPVKAISLGIKICTNFIKNRNQDGILIPEEINIPQEFSLNGIIASYKVDMSQIWSDLIDTNEEIQMCKDIFRFFDELVAQKEIDKLLGFIDIYIKNATMAYCWALLLDWAAKNAEIVHQKLYVVLLQPSILYWSDTIQQAGSFLENAVVFFNPEKLKKIEHTILKLPELVPDEMKTDAQSRTFRLLSRISKESLQDPIAIAMFADKEPVANDDLVEFTSTCETLTTRIYLQEKGVDVKDPLLDELLEIEQRLSSFNRSYERYMPKSEVFVEPLALAEKAFEKVNSAENLSPEVEKAVMTTVAGLCVLVLKADAMGLEHDEKLATDYGMIKKLLVDCLNRHTDSDTFAEENYSAGGTFSSTAKSEAAGGLINLYVLTKDDTLLPLIEKFSQDKNSVTRFHLLQFLGRLYEPQRELFWKILNRGLQEEQDNFIWSDLVLKLDRKKIFEEEAPRFKNALEIGKYKATLVEKGYTFFDNFLIMSMAFFRKTADEQVKKIILECLETNGHIAQRMVWQVFKLIEPENPYRNIRDDNDRLMSKRLVDLFIGVLDTCEKELTQPLESEEMREEISRSFELINEIILRIYFSLQVNERGLSKRDRWPITDEDRRLFYPLIKPLLVRVMQISDKISFIQPSTAHRYIEIMGTVVEFDAEYALFCVHRIAEMSTKGYIQDRSAIQEVVKFTEKLLSDHRGMLADSKSFSYLKGILEIYATAGWPEALTLLWQLDDIFR